MVPPLSQVMGPGEGMVSPIQVLISHMLELHSGSTGGELQPHVPQAISEARLWPLDSLKTRTFSALCLLLTMMFNCFHCQLVLPPLVFCSLLCNLLWHLCLLLIIGIQSEIGLGMGIWSPTI